MDQKYSKKLNADYYETLDEKYLEVLAKFKIIDQMEERLTSVRSDVAKRQYNLTLKKQIKNASALLDSEDLEKTYVQDIFKAVLKDRGIDYDSEADEIDETEYAEELVKISELISEAGNLVIAVAALKKDFDECYAQLYPPS